MLLVAPVLLEAQVQLETQVQSEAQVLLEAQPMLVWLVAVEGVGLMVSPLVVSPQLQPRVCRRLLVV